MGGSPSEPFWPDELCLLRTDRNAAESRHPEKLIPPRRMVTLSLMDSGGAQLSWGRGNPTFLSSSSDAMNRPMMPTEWQLPRRIPVWGTGNLRRRVGAGKAGRLYLWGGPSCRHPRMCEGEHTARVWLVHTTLVGEVGSTPVVVKI